MMKKFMKDYAELCKDTGRFYKKHWFGLIVMNTAVIGAELAYFNRDRIKEKFEKRFHKNGGEA